MEGGGLNESLFVRCEMKESPWYFTTLDGGKGPVEDKSPLLFLWNDDLFLLKLQLPLFGLCSPDTNHMSPPTTHI